MPEFKDVPVPHMYKWDRLNLKQLGQLLPEDQISGFPMARFIKIISARLPDNMAEDANTYGKLGGDFLQHADMRALDITAQDTACNLVVRKIYPDEQKIYVQANLPRTKQRTAAEIWGRAQMNLYVPFSMLEPPKSKIRRKVGEAVTRLLHKKT